VVVYFGRMGRWVVPVPVEAASLQIEYLTVVPLVLVWPARMAAVALVLVL
jgi:hypothetical protein